MKDFFRFLAHPTQEKTAKPRDLAFASVLYFLVGPVICVAGTLAAVWFVFYYTLDTGCLFLQGILQA